MYDACSPLIPTNRSPEHGSNLMVPSQVGVDAAVGQPEGGIILIVVWSVGVAVVKAMSEKGPPHVECAETQILCQAAKLRVGIMQAGQQ